MEKIEQDYTVNFNTRDVFIIRFGFKEVGLGTS